MESAVVSTRVTFREGTTFGKGRIAHLPDQTILRDGEPQVMMLPIAYNDPPGTWGLTATDLFTEETRQVTTIVVR